jgi:hypothetical protein
VNVFRPVEDLAELADVPSWCGDVARDGCFCAWNVSVTRSTVLYGGEGGENAQDQSLHCRCVNDSLPAYGLKNSTGRKPCTAL